jgi:molybdate transport system permease protein
MPTSDEWIAIRLSLIVSGVAVACALPLAIACGYGLARVTFRGKWLVEVLLNLPLVLPPVVVGYLLLLVLGRRGWLGRWLDLWGMRISFTWAGAALAAAVVAFPLMARACRIAFAGVDVRYELAARTLGAGRWEAFRRVALPLARRGVLAAAVLGFARSLSEFGATIMLAGNIPGATRTIPLAIYSAAQRVDGDASATRLVCVSVVLAAAALGTCEWLEHRRDGHGPH